MFSRNVAASVLLTFLLGWIHPAQAELIVKDHVSDSSLWDGIDTLVGQRKPVSLPDDDIGVAAAFTGNGQTLKTVSAIFAHDSGFGVPNEGTPEFLRFRISFFETTADYIADPFSEATNSPSLIHIFSDPTNANWLTPVGTAEDGHLLFHWEFDVEFLGVQTTSGQEHLVSIMPETSFVSGSTLIAYSRGGVGAIGDRVDWGRSELSDIGPDTLRNLGAPYDFGAYRVTSVPEPSSFVFCFSMLLIYALKHCATKVAGI